MSYPAASFEGDEDDDDADADAPGASGPHAVSVKIVAAAIQKNAMLREMLEAIVTKVYAKKKLELPRRPDGRHGKAAPI